MKKLVVITLIGVIGFVFSAQEAFSIGIPSVSGSKTEKVVKDVAGDVAKTVVIDDLNKYLGSQSCKCDVKTGAISGCDVDAIGKKIDSNRKPLKTALNRSIKFHVRSADVNCSHKFTNAYKTRYSYWYGWYTPIDRSLGSNVKLWVN